MPDEDQITALAFRHGDMPGFFTDRRYADGGDALVGHHIAARLRHAGYPRLAHLIHQGPDRGIENILDLIGHRFAVPIGNDGLVAVVYDQRHVEEGAIGGHFAVVAGDPVLIVFFIDIPGGSVSRRIVMQRGVEQAFEGLQRTGSGFPRALVVQFIGIVCDPADRRQHHQGDDCDDQSE